MQIEIAERELVELLGPEQVCSDPGQLGEAEQATFQTEQSIRLIVSPRTRDEICQVLRIANRTRIPVYPVSSGKNWGYGSRVPVQDGSILLNLASLNRIVAFDEKLAYVTVEPGVTQRDLRAHLVSQKSSLWMDATGSSPDCSLIGNAMERGFGHTPYGDHFAHVCGMEVVLPTGEVIETGFSGLAGAKTGPLYKWGMGPSLDGLFSQSNLGVVTRMSIWLMPKPEYFQAFFFQSSADDIGLVVDALRPLRLNGTLKSAIHIGNDYKVLAGIQQFPAGEPAPLGKSQMERLRKMNGIARWSGSGALYGTRRQVAEARRLVKKALSGKVDRVQFLDDKRVRLASKFIKPYRMFTGMDLRRTLELLKPVYGLLKGEPTDQSINSAYWRKKSPIPEFTNPDRDGCGLLWYAPVAPMDGTIADRLVSLTEAVLLRHGFEPMISLTLLTERCIAAVISITYDRETAGEDAKALSCYLELEQRLIDEGCYPYRLGIKSMGRQEGRGSYSSLLANLKHVVDPNGILAPGRYVPASARTMNTTA